MFQTIRMHHLGQWWWSTFSPAIPTIRVQIPLKPTVFIENLSKATGLGPFKKEFKFQSMLVVLLCNFFFRLAADFYTCSPPGLNERVCWW